MTQEGLWEAFGRDATELASLIASRQMRQAFDRMERLLQEHGLDLCFDLTSDPDGAVLILTPEGNPDVARRIDELLAERPRIDGWKFYGRRPRKPVEDAFKFVLQIWNVDISDATFDVIERESGCEVTLYSRATNGLPEDKIDGVMATFLDHALGESVAMLRVVGVDASSNGVGRYSPAAMVEVVTGS